MEITHEVTSSGILPRFENVNISVEITGDGDPAKRILIMEIVNSLQNTVEQELQRWREEFSHLEDEDLGELQSPIMAASPEGEPDVEPVDVPGNTDEEEPQGDPAAADQAEAEEEAEQSHQPEPSPEFPEDPQEDPQGDPFFKLDEEDQPPDETP